jgi:dipeptidyl aminopeptidase/acylaminoacyl peptidase
MKLSGARKWALVGGCLAVLHSGMAQPAPAAPDTAALAAAAAALPAATFFDHPGVSIPRLSPDGTKIAFLFPHEGRMALGVFDRATKQADMVVRGRDESIDSFVWKGDRHLIFIADFEGNEADFIASVDLATKKVRRIAESYGQAGRSGSNLYVIDWLPQDPEHIVIGGYLKGSGHFLTDFDESWQVIKLNVTNGKRQALFQPPSEDSELFHWDFITDGRAQVRFMTTVRQRVVKRWYRDDNTGRFREVMTEERDSYLSRWGWVETSADGRRIYVIDHTEDDRGSLREFDPVTLKCGPALFVPPEGEITDLLWSPDGNTLTGVAYAGIKRAHHWFDPKEAELRQKLEATFPGFQVSVVSSSRDGKVRLVHITSDREPGVYFVLDLGTGSMVQFKRMRDGIDPRLMAPMQPIRFTARDGLELHGYVTVPLAASGRPVPLVVLPHGGPIGPRDTFGFDPEVQFLASRGYAVLQVNFRGSGGYGQAFRRLGKNQWGRAMQDDLTDGVKWAVAQGIADPKRIAIYGASYGGYAAMAGVTLTPELYRCAVNYLGPVDLEITGRARGADAWMQSVDYDHRAEWIGPTKEYRDATNPVVLAERIRVPTLHAYGRNDPRVQTDHASRLEAALKKRGKTYEMIRSKHAGHGFDDPKESITFYLAMEKFLKQNLAP